jgi:hypothetical protein
MPEPAGADQTHIHQTAQIITRRRVVYVWMNLRRTGPVVGLGGVARVTVCHRVQHADVVVAPALGAVVTRRLDACTRHAQDNNDRGASILGVNDSFVSSY